jgi:NADH-ubiquinone oxidoreductase chain 1
LAETNRTPFDFAEGESDLVSGFNVGYGGGGFALIFFFTEYASILFMRLICCIIILGSDLYSFFFMLSLLLSLFLFIWVRGVGVLMLTKNADYFPKQH